MYPHRPDLLSLVFGVTFLVVGLLAVANPSGLPGLDLYVVLAALAVAGGTGLVASLATGDVHERAARRRAASRSAGPRAMPMTLPPPPAADPSAQLMDDPLFGPPIDPDELDRVYRETFGGQDPAQNPSEGAAGGSADREGTAGGPTG